MEEEKSKSKDIDKSWIGHLRQQARLTGREGNKPDGGNSGKPEKVASAGEGTRPSPNKPPDLRRGTNPEAGDVARSQRQQDSERSSTSSHKREGSRSRSQSPPKRSKGVRSAEDSRDEFKRGPTPSKGRLWTEDDNTTLPRPQVDKSNIASKTKLHIASPAHTRPSRQAPQTQFSVPRPPIHVADGSVELIKQPETRPISQEQLVAEVKGIYAGLVMVENKCIEVDTAQNTQNDPNKLNNEQWQALIALHRTLLHEHHDFFSGITASFCEPCSKTAGIKIRHARSDVASWHS